MKLEDKIAKKVRSCLINNISNLETVIADVIKQHKEERKAEKKERFCPKHIVVSMEDSTEYTLSLTPERLFKPLEPVIPQEIIDQIKECDNAINWQDVNEWLAKVKREKAARVATDIIEESIKSVRKPFFRDFKLDETKKKVSFDVGENYFIDHSVSVEQTRCFNLCDPCLLESVCRLSHSSGVTKCNKYINKYTGFDNSK